MMGSSFLALLGKIDLHVQNQPIGKAPFFLFEDVMLIVTLSLTLMLALMLWAKYLRTWKPKKRRSEGQKVYRENADGTVSSVPEEEEEQEESQDDSPPSVRRRYKYRYKRRGHRVRNPTLAETGGLPPTRSGESTRPS
jgi:hypothetical protein